MLAIHYFVLAGGRKGDRLALQAFVACLVVLGAAAVIVDASVRGLRHPFSHVVQLMSAFPRALVSWHLPE